MIRLLAACSPGEVRVAAWDGVLRDYAVWRPGRPDGVGDLHWGRVSAVARGLGGSFVAIDGAEGFLPDTERSGPVSEGEMLAVRVTRAAQGGKGPRLTARVDGGAVDTGEAVRLIARGPGAVERLAGQYPAASVLIDDRGMMARLLPALGGRLHWVERGFGPEVEDEVAGLGARDVALDGGGRLRIEPTAALVAIDVDSGGGLEGGARAAAHLAFNAGVVSELARQIRLRNLSGAIVVDFAGLAAKRRARLGEGLRAALAADPVECRLVGFTGLGLAEIVRRRVHPPLHEVLAGPHAAAALAWREVGHRWRPGVGLRIRAAPDVVAAAEADAAMRADAARLFGAEVTLAADAGLRAGRFCVEEA